MVWPEFDDLPSFNTELTSSEDSDLDDVCIDIDSSIGSELNEAGVAQTNKKEYATYMVDGTFDNKELALEAVKKEGYWSIKGRSPLVGWEKVFYRCNLVQKKGKQCAARLCLLYNLSNNKVFLLRSISRHTHMDIPTKRKAYMSEAVKAEIKKLFEIKAKPKEILYRLSLMETLNSFHLPSKTQVNNYLAYLKKQMHGDTRISLRTLETWLEEKSVVPTEDDDPFILNYEVKYASGDFRYFVTTLTLLKLALKADKLHVDATYGLIYERFPVIVIGTTDQDRHFHCFGIAVCYGETEADFSFVFRSLEDGVRQHTVGYLKIDVLIADAAKSIRNAFIYIFGEDIRIMTCWSHAKKVIGNKCSLLKDKEKKSEVMNDVDALQLSPSEPFFKKATEMFLKKWRKQKDFVQYFKTQWVDANANWYEGAQLLAPSTNNAIEAFNRVLKDTGTNRERHPLSRFRAVGMNIVSRLSREYMTQSKVFASQPSVTSQMWSAAYQWQEKKNTPSVLKEETEDECTIFVAATENQRYFNRSVKSYIEQKWRTFDDYKKKVFAVWKVTLKKDTSLLYKGECTCPDYLKKFMCKHIIGLSIYYLHLEPPAEAMDRLIGPKRKRGRPSRASYALRVQH